MCIRHATLVNVRSVTRWWDMQHLHDLPTAPTIASLFKKKKFILSDAGRYNDKLVQVSSPLCDAAAARTTADTVSFNIRM